MLLEKCLKVIGENSFEVVEIINSNNYGRCLMVTNEYKNRSESEIRNIACNLIDKINQYSDLRDGIDCVDFYVKQTANEKWSKMCLFLKEL